MKEREVSTQAELDQAIKDGEIPILIGNGVFTISGSSQVRAYDSSQVRAYDSSQVTACGSSQVRACDSSQVTAYGSSQVRAYGSSQVTAYDSSQVRAYDSSQVTAYDSSQVTASTQVAVSIHGAAAKIVGGHQIKITNPKTATQWCSYYGIEIKNGVAVLFKAVSDEFKSNRGFDYTPGTVPIAPDWDGGERECGSGLHFSPRPFMALKFFADAKRFVACPVLVKDIAVHPDGQYPQKVKASGCCGKVWECDKDGTPVTPKKEAA